MSVYAYGRCLEGVLELVVVAVEIFASAAVHERFVDVESPLVLAFFTVAAVCLLAAPVALQKLRYEFSCSIDTERQAQFWRAIFSSCGRSRLWGVGRISEQTTHVRWRGGCVVGNSLTCGTAMIMTRLA